MNILHTSDWHIGKRLMDRDRLPEQIEALKELVESMYQENIEIEGLLPRDQDPIISMESRFNVVVHRGETVYKSLPCGELQYDASGLKKVQIGFRTTGISFIL